MNTNTPKYRRVYIRHADKEYVNGDSDIYKHDPGITNKGVDKAKMVARHLINQWGLPTRIIISPYRRTRETAKAMKSVLNEVIALGKSNAETNTNTNTNTTKNKKIPIHIDRELSEYLGNHRTTPIDVTESTLVHDPPHPETFADMKRRVKSHHDKIVKYVKKSESVIWIITHGLIIKQVAALVGLRMVKDFPSLTCLSIMDDGDNTKGEIIMFQDGLGSENVDINEDEISDSAESDNFDKYNTKYEHNFNINFNSNKVDSRFDSKFDPKFDSKFDSRFDSKFDSKKKYNAWSN